MRNRLFGCCCGGTCSTLDVTFDTTEATSWVNHFDYLDSSGDPIYNGVDEFDDPIPWEPGDALPSFVAGQQLVSISYLPAVNWAADFTQLMPANWFKTDGNVLTIELIDAADVVRLSISITSEKDDDPNEQVIVGFSYVDAYFHYLAASLTINDETGTESASDDFYIATASQPYASPPNEYPFTNRGFGMVVRRTVVEVGSQYSASGNAYGTTRSTIPNVPSDPFYVPIEAIRDTFKRFGLRYGDELPACKLKISIAGVSATLGSLYTTGIQNEIFTDSGGGYYSSSSVENTTCPDLATCSLISPFQHVLWNAETTISGMVAGGKLTNQYTGCNGLLFARGSQELGTLVYTDGSPYQTFTFGSMTASLEYDTTVTIEATEVDDDEIDLLITVAIEYQTVSPFTDEEITASGWTPVNTTGGFSGTGWWLAWTTGVKTINVTKRVPRWIGTAFTPLVIPGTDFLVGTSTTLDRDFNVMTAVSLVQKTPVDTFGDTFIINGSIATKSVDDFELTLSVL